MSLRRLSVLLSVLAAACCLVLCRVIWIGTDTGYMAEASAQTVARAVLPRQRGDFYDRAGRRLTGAEASWYAFCMPGDNGYTALFPYVSYGEQALLYSRRNSAVPFLLPVDRDLTAAGIYTFRAQRRILRVPIAEHLIGYLDGENHGVAGLELAYDDLLYAANDDRAVECAANAQGVPITGETPQTVITQPGTGQTVQLTLDAPLQRLCEGIARQMPRGCILVMECETGNILASVSRPDFDPEHVEESIAANDTSLINRALAEFSAGSVFKVVSAVAAYTGGLDWYTWDCTGSTEAAGRQYRCAQGRAHGTLNLRGALEESCNCYFIHLAQRLGAPALRETAEKLGFGRAAAVAPGLKSAAGNLPTAAALQNPAQLAMFSFGQGELTVTPLQITAMMNAIADGGWYRAPQFVAGLRDTASGTLTPAVAAEAEAACTADIARVLRSMLTTVVENGIGEEAAPGQGRAGGKTGTAQTGRRDAQGRELLNYWFTGFYPADAPVCTITVLQDGIVEPRVSSAALFAQVADALRLQGIA